MAQVALENVTKRYGEVIAVDAIDLRVEDEELCVLVGPSGCGKTTTLRLIAGLEDATSGRIYIGGHVVNHVAPKDRNVAMVDKIDTMLAGDTNVFVVVGAGHFGGEQGIVKLLEEKGHEVEQVRQ
jgi:ABC-type sulfate/molybdate transport systems ATPase subunit